MVSLAGGIAQAGLEAATDYAQTRKQFKRAISEFQGVQWLLADMAKDIQAARLLVADAALKIDDGAEATMACSIAKCFAGDMAVARSADAVQVFAAQDISEDLRWNGFIETQKSVKYMRELIKYNE